MTSDFTQPKPADDARLCSECRGLGQYLPTFSANHTVCCSTCGGAGWLPPAAAFAPKGQR